MKNEPQLPPPPIIYRVMQVMMWPLLKLFRMSCKTTYDLCSEQMDRKLTIGESMRLRLHLMMCGVCRHLPDQFSSLRELVRTCENDHEHEENPDASLSPEARERIIARLKIDDQSKS